MTFYPQGKGRRTEPTVAALYVETDGAYFGLDGETQTRIVPTMPHKDPEARKAYSSAYRESRREEAKQTAAEWRAKNPGRNAANAKRWREENAEKAKELQREYRKNNREKVRETQRAWRERTGYNQSSKRKEYTADQQLRVYGLTRQDYDTLLEAQEGGCAICRSADPGMKHARRLYVDHCHATNRVRGLLCRACNTMLGCVGDKPELLIAGASYLERG
jgi:hypothetical protein